MPARNGRRKVAVTSSSDDGGPASPQPRLSRTGENTENSARALNSLDPMSRTKRLHVKNDAAESSTSRNSGKLKPAKKKEPAKPVASPSSTQEMGSQRSSGKPRPALSKAKAGTKDAAKPSSKPIYSFFNAATQRQASSQPSASPEKRPSVHGDDMPETIDSEDEANASLKLSKDSSIALTLRKRKVHQISSFAESANLRPPPTQKFRKTGENGRVPSFSAIVVQDTTPWTERFAPLDLTELAVHKRKVQDVTGWLQSTLAGRRQKVLVLKGAAGTAKTTTVRLLAKDLGLEVVEWRNPGSVDAGEGGLGGSAQFDEFVNRAGRSGGLRLSTSRDEDTHVDAPLLINGDSRGKENPHMLLIEEFPTSLSRTSTSLQSFRSTILQYVSSSVLPQQISPIPIVMVISETLLSADMDTTDSFTAHRLLGPELVNHPYINTFEFNPIAPTILTKALELVVVKEARKSGRRRTPGTEVLKRLAESGDIRSAVSSLEFMCLRGDDADDMWSSKVAFTKTKKRAQSAITKGEEEVLRLISNRESSLGIFHAVGRVCYNNRVDPASAEAVMHPPDWLPQSLRRPKIPERDVDELINELGTDVSTFIAALHENYARSCYTTSAEGTLTSLSESIDRLSDADLISVDKFSSGGRPFATSATEAHRQDEMAFQNAVRGLLFNLPYPVHRSMGGEARKGDSHKMFYPASLKIWRKRQEVEDVIDMLMMDAQKGRLGRSMYEPRRRAKKDVVSDQASGVDTWARQNTFTGQAAPSKAEADNRDEISHVAVAKTELLLEQLPYAARILQSRHADDRQAAISLDMISSVTRITGQAQEHNEDDEEDDTERSDRFLKPLAKHVNTDLKRPSHSRQMLVATNEPETLERAVTDGADIGGLVLADDDIED